MKVALLRKLWKKVGQAWEVKLLPREVSNGLGRGDEGPAVDEAVSMLPEALPVNVALPVDVALALSVIVFVGVTTSVL